MKKAKLFMMLALLVMGVSNVMGEEFTEGVFRCNTTYTQSTNNEINLGTEDGMQCIAISLDLGKTKSVKDTVYYTSRHNSTGNDDDGDGAGSSASWSSIGTYPSVVDNANRYFYERNHTVAYPGTDVTSVTIPATITHNGTTYKVVAIQKFGFNYAQTKAIWVSRMETTGYGWNQTTECNEKSGSACLSRSNRELKEVKFASNSNIKYIGDYAFMGCDKLSKITLPSTIEYLGTGAFELCDWLQKCEFQNDECHFSNLKNFTFWLCVSLKNLQLPDGITEIEGRQTGGSLQYLLSLTDIRLPNTVTDIGPHFLCCAGSLLTLSIPASVTYIDAACFHGCEKLKEVYLLGPASALQLGDPDSQTFGANSTFCKDYVSDCTFYTTPDYVDSYADHSVWALIADNQVGGYLCEVDDNGNILYENGQPVYALDADGNKVKVKTPSGNGNRLVPIAEVKRTFEADKWVTAVFADKVIKHKVGNETITGMSNVFGEGTRVAKMTGATTSIGTDPQTGKTIRLYNLSFTLVPESEFEADVPYMFCPKNKVENYIMISKETYRSQAFKEKMTQDMKKAVTADDGNEVDMLGHYKDWDLYDFCFYFSYKSSSTQTTEDETAKFYRVPEGSKLTSAPTRCFWYVKVNGIKTRVGAKVASQRFFDDDENNSTTGIDNIPTKVVIEGIYDLNGRKLDIKPEDLPQGMFIINGKKVLKK